MRTATIHSLVPAANDAMRSDAPGSSDATSCRDPALPRQQLANPPSVFLVAGNDQAAGVGLPAAHLPESIDRVVQHTCQPLAVKRQRGTQPLIGELSVQPIVERRHADHAIRRAPLHHAANCGEVGRPNHAAVT
jgi:hypothetical protein